MPSAPDAPASGEPNAILRRYPWLAAEEGGEAAALPPPTPWETPVGRGSGPYAAFGAPLAGWWQRVGAMVLDGLVLGVPSVVVTIVVFLAASTPRTVVVGGTLATTQSLSGTATACLYGAMALAGACYFSYFNGTGKGQTPGNRAPGIAVRDVRTGSPIGFWRGFLRWLVRFLLYAAFLVPGFVNDLFPLWSGRRQTLADMAARSVMVKLG